MPFWCTEKTETQRELKLGVCSPNKRQANSIPTFLGLLETPQGTVKLPTRQQTLSLQIAALSLVGALVAPDSSWYICFSAPGNWLLGRRQGSVLDSEIQTEPQSLLAVVRLQFLEVACGFGFAMLVICDTRPLH